MKRRRPSPPPVKVELTPLIDVTFLILIFFLFTIRFKTLEGRLEAWLPKDVGGGRADTVPVERARIAVQVVSPGERLDPISSRPWSGEGAWRHGEDRVLRYDAGPHPTSSLPAVVRWLTDLHAENPELEVVIDAREGVDYADVVGLVDAARLIGCESITFAGVR